MGRGGIPGNRETPYPRTAIQANGGAQVYGWTSTQNWPTVNTHTLARFNLVSLGGTYEKWSDSGRDRELLTTSVKTGSGNGRPPSSVTPLVFYYQILGQTLKTTPLVPTTLGGAVTAAANDSYPTYSTMVGAWNWWGYQAGPNQTTHYAPTLTQGSALDIDNFGASPVLYTYDYVNGNPWAGRNSAGEGPYEFGAKYSVYKLLSKNRALDSRFSGLNAGLGSPSADGVFFDNIFRWPNQSDGGSQNGLNYQIDGNRDGTTDTQAGYDDPPADYYSAGDFIKYAQVQVTASLLGRAKTYNIGNFQQYAWSVSSGVAPYDMNQVLHGGLIESYFGLSSSPDHFTTTANIIGKVQTAIGRCQSPKLVWIGCRWPTSDPGVPHDGLFPNANMTIGSTSYYQYFRYCAAFCAVQGAYCAWNSLAYGYGAGDTISEIEWFDEYDNAGSASGWLGHPVAGPTGAVGGYLIANGVYAREFDNGLVLWNPPNNPVTTLTAAQLGGSGKWKHLSGTQVPSVNDGSVVTTSVTLGTKDGSGSSRDGLFLIRV